MKHAADFFRTARARFQIRALRLAGAPPPWSNDPVFREWRFCNVHREHDKTTIWFRENIRDILSRSGMVYNIVLGTIAFRWFNRIETAELIKDLLLGPWDSDEARRRLDGVEPVVTGAYMMNTPPFMPKLEGVLWMIDNAAEVLAANPMHRSWGDSIQRAWRDLTKIDRLGKFTAYEVATDLRWTPVLSGATDINSWASAGPGCARGLGWLVDGNPGQFNYGSQRDQDKMLELMRELLAMSRDQEHWPYNSEAPWEMREVEHWLCEHDKYMRASGGQRQKRRFTY